MATAGVASAFMNNVGVAAILLPVVMDLSRETRIPPSRLLLPLAYACLLGGLTTLIGTPPNILVAEALRKRRIGGEGSEGDGERVLPDIYGLNERFIILRLPEASPLAGKSLGEIRLGSVAGLQAITVIRDGRPRPLPGPGFRLRAGDRIVAQGPVDRLDQLRDSSALDGTHAPRRGLLRPFRGSRNVDPARRDVPAGSPSGPAPSARRHTAGPGPAGQGRGSGRM